MNTRQTGAHLKLARARQHLDYLADQVNLWTSQPHHRLVTEAEDDGATHVVRIRDLRPVPDDWSVIVGELLHNLRSALDHVAWQLVLDGGGKPGRDTEFPILPQPNDGRVRKMLRGATPEAVDVMLRLQPYRRQPDPNVRSREPLLVLHRLNIIDKHRLLVVAARVADRAEWYMPEEAVGCGVTPILQPLYEGAEVIRFTNVPGRPKHLDFQPRVELSVWIAETEETPYLVLPTGLDPIFDAVAAVIAGFTGRYVHQAPS